MTNNLKPESHYRRKFKLSKKQWERYKWKIIRYWLGEEEVLSLKNKTKV